MFIFYFHMWIIQWLWLSSDFCYYKLTILTKCKPLWCIVGICSVFLPVSGDGCVKCFAGFCAQEESAGHVTEQKKKLMEEVILTLLFKYYKYSSQVLFGSIWSTKPFVQYTEEYWAHEEIVSRESNDTHTTRLNQV